MILYNTLVKLLASDYVIQTKEHLTGASNRPVKNFLMHLAATTCAGVTGGSFTHGLPAVKNKYTCENKRKPLSPVYWLHKLFTVMDITIKMIDTNCQKHVYLCECHEYAHYSL